MAKRMGWTASLFVIAGLASLGLPGLSGFVAELLVFLGLFQTYPILGALGVIGAAITAVYMLRLLSTVVFGESDDEHWAKLLDKKFEKAPDGWRIERASSLVLAGFLLLVGLFPFPFIRVIDSGVADILAAMARAV